MISFLKIYLFSLAGLAMGILNLAIVIPQVITFLNVFFPGFGSVPCIFGVHCNYEQIMDPSNPTQ